MDNSVTRYVLTKGFLNSEKQIVPFWDVQVRYEEDSEGYDFVRLKEDQTLFERQLQFIECVYDLATRNLSLGNEIDIYPELDKLEFKAGQEVLFEDPRKYRHLRKDKIKKVIFEEYQVKICKGKDLQDHLRKEFIPSSVQLDGLYVIKHWEPTYVLQSRAKTKYTHKLYNLVED